VSNLKTLRLNKKLSQQKLSNISGVSRGTIVMLENKENVVTTTKTLKKLAIALGVRIDELI
jgi:transcriptional regulator with XRE-family HTH domain